MAVIKSEYLLPNYDPEEVGMKGEKGDDGKTTYVHIAYSNSSDGGVDFSTTDPTNRAYTGYYTDFEMIDSTDPSKYEWQRTKGDSGKDGLAGKDGVGLQSTDITYASHPNASTPPATGWQTQVPTVPAGQYLWTKTVWTYTDSSSETGYSVARMGQDGADGQLFTGETEPTDFNEGDVWYKVVSGKVTGVYEAKGGTWVEIPFESSVIAETIIGKTIQASHLTGSTIDGGKISGAEFLNEYENVTSGVNQVTDGKIGIKDGILQAGSTYYLTNSSGERLYAFSTTEADIHQGTVNLRQRLYNESGSKTSESTTSVSGGLITLSLSDASGNYHGVLDAKALTNTPWNNLQFGSLYETRDSNPPQYRVSYNLDGTRTITFRGAIGLKSGAMTAGQVYRPFSTGNSASTPTLPASVRPNATVQKMASTSNTSAGQQGARIAVTPSGDFPMWSNGNLAAGDGYIDISAMTYTIA